MHTTGWKQLNSSSQERSYSVELVNKDATQSRVRLHRHVTDWAVLFDPLLLLQLSSIRLRYLP